MRIPMAAAGLREMALATLIVGVPGLLAWVGAGLGHAWCWPVAVVLTLLWGLVIGFFRDPERGTPADPDFLVAPADGRVTELTRLDHDPIIGGPATRFGIFLSVLDVHINRSPCAGVVREIHYRPGKFLDARDPASGAMNEANTIVIDTDDPAAPTIVVHQIAGRIARRIVCNVKVGDRLAPGQRIGMIKFGSRTELVVPGHDTYRPLVGVGDRARGAATVMARRNRAPAETRQGPAERATAVAEGAA